MLMEGGKSIRQNIKQLENLAKSNHFCNRAISFIEQLNQCPQGSTWHIQSENDELWWAEVKECQMSVLL